MVQSRSDTTMSRGRSEEVPVATFSAVPCSVFTVALAHTNVFADLAFLAPSAASRVRGGLRCAAKSKSGPPGHTVHQIGRHFRPPAHNFVAKRGEDTRGACAREAMAQSVRERVRTRIDVRSISCCVAFVLVETHGLSYQPTSPHTRLRNVLEGTFLVNWLAQRDEWISKVREANRLMGLKLHQDCVKNVDFIV